MGDKRRVLCVNFVLVVTKLLVTKNTTNTQRSQSCSPGKPEFEFSAGGFNCNFFFADCTYEL